MAHSTNQYTSLITSEHADKAKFMEMIRRVGEIFVQIQNVVQSIPEKFDLDNARGVQLDVIGRWVGISRRIPIPISGVYFSWDGVDSLGWDYGVWENPTEPTAVSTLPDDVYLNLIRAKIAANGWDGTTPGAYAIWARVFPTINILIIDHQDMTMALAVVGGTIDSLTLALLTNGLIPLKPEGVGITAYFIPVNTGPLFGFDVDSEFLAGWDDGSWAREVLPT